MLRRPLNLLFVTALLMHIPLLSGIDHSSSEKNDIKSVKAEKACEEKEEFVETKHEVVIDGKKLAYKAVVGNIHLKNEKCDPTASIFFTSYTKEGDVNGDKRPITFCFNGGPGSSSVWLHLGCFGPKRVMLSEDGDAIPPFQLTENEFSILDFTDLVFIDPVSTGYSRAIPPDAEKKFHGVEEDVKSIADFIRLFITKYNRWNSPKFIAGESYGTTRAASLTEYLHDNYFIYINGVVLVSSVLNFQSIDFAPGNDLPYLLFFPSYTATAWYHEKLPAELQKLSLDQVLSQSRQFVVNEYAQALFKGSLLTEKEREITIEKISKLTGLSHQYIDRSHLRIEMSRFAKELMRETQKSVGRFDSRFQGIQSDILGDKMEYDPSIESILGVFTSTLNNYIKTELNWNTDNHYVVLTSVQPWNYGNQNQYLNVAENLRNVMTKNPHLRVFVANGYYDLATPFFATEYTFNHLGLEDPLMKHVKMKYYEAGHMMYIYKPILKQMKSDLREYYTITLQEQEKATSSNEATKR